MRHNLVITIATLVIVALVYFIVDSLSNDSRAAIGSVTISGLTSLILFSAHYSNELKRNS